MTYVDELAADLRGSYDDEMWLGHLCWYYVPTAFKIKLKDWMLAIHKSPIRDLVPNPPRSVDAFKRAVNSSKDTRKISLPDNVGSYTYKFLPADSGDDKEHVYRSIIVEELDAQNHRLSYRQVVTFKYHRAEERILPPMIDHSHMKMYSEMMQQLIMEKVNDVINRYYSEVDMLNHTKVRDMIRVAITGPMQGVLARPGGSVFFVFNEHLERLTALENLVKEHLDGCTFHSFPLIRDDKQVEMVKHAYEQETVAAVDQLMHDMGKLLAGKRGKVTPAKARKMHERYLAMHQNTQDYIELLSDPLSVASTKLKIMEKQIVSVFRNVNHD